MTERRSSRPDRRPARARPTDRDPRPPVPVLDPGQRRELVELRLEAVRELLDRAGAPGILLSSRRTFAWLTVGGLNHVVLSTELGVAPLLVTGGGAVVLAPVSEAARLETEELAGLPIRVESMEWSEPGTAAGRATELAGGQPFPDAALAHDLVLLRSVLAPPERERLAWLGGMARRALEAALAAIGPGRTEDDAAAELAAGVARIGARAAVLVAAADDRSVSFSPPSSTSRPIGRRLMLGLVAERWGLHVAATSFADLEPPDAETARRMAACADILAAMRAATRPGRTLGDVIDEAMNAYALAGFPGEWRLGHQGGPIGYAPRERIATPGDRTLILPGMAFAWNPSIAGAKAEETFILGDDGDATVVTVPPAPEPVSARRRARAAAPRAPGRSSSRSSRSSC